MKWKQESNVPCLLDKLVNFLQNINQSSNDIDRLYELMKEYWSNNPGKIIKGHFKLDIFDPSISGRRVVDLHSQTIFVELNSTDLSTYITKQQLQQALNMAITCGGYGVVSTAIP